MAQPDSLPRDEMLERKINWFQMLLDNIGEGVAVIDRSFQVLLWNKSAETLSGWAAEEAISRPLDSFLKFTRERDRADNSGFIREAISFGEPRRMENYTVLMTKDEKEIPMGATAAPTFDNTGAISGAILVFRDVSKDRDLRLQKEEISKMRQAAS